MSEKSSPYLEPGEFVNSDAPEIIAFAKKTIGDAADETEKALLLFHAIRDDIIYDPYLPMGKKESYTAIDALKSGRGWCVPKAALLAACARSIGIQARCGYADVRNHLATKKLLDAVGTDMFFWHSYCDLFLKGKWVKATPAFNKSMCDKFGLKPLEFDGENDSLFHEFDVTGRKHMEYVNERGTYADVPFQEIIATFAAEYKGVAEHFDDGLEGDFQKDIDAELN
ncbi:MAG: transglutaminase family protein [Alphaproteobacteria bacterium]|nr:transglutaminase family protein [Rhodospirillales bacterium]MCW9044749.1 transglutaminase family protein [Alphaproteobacteria bacterium]